MYDEGGTLGRVRRNIWMVAESLHKEERCSAVKSVDSEGAADRLIFARFPVRVFVTATIRRRGQTDRKSTRNRVWQDTRSNPGPPSRRHGPLGHYTIPARSWFCGYDFFQYFNIHIII